MRVPLVKVGCLVPAVLVIAFSLAGCYGIVQKYAPDGKTVAAEFKVPLGMEYDAASDKLTGDPKTVDAMGKAANAAIQVAGDEVAKHVIDKAMDQQVKP